MAGAARRDGDILVADRAHTDFGFINALALRHVFFVVREKTNVVMAVVETLQDPVEYDGESIAPAMICCEATLVGRAVLSPPRRVGNNAPYRYCVTIFHCRIYKSTQILAVELFFKELKQICQLHDFVGYNENAVKWQIWTGFLPFTMTPVG